MLKRGTTVQMTTSARATLKGKTRSLADMYFSANNAATLERSLAQRIEVKASLAKLLGVSACTWERAMKAALHDARVKETNTVDQFFNDELESAVRALEAKWQGIKAYRANEQQATPAAIAHDSELSAAWLSGYEYERAEAQQRASA